VKGLSLRLLVVYISILLVVCMILSCTSQRKVQKWNALHPGAAAQNCADQFPPRDSVSIVDSVHFDTLYVENETVLRDSFFIKGDTVVRIVDKKCQPVQQIIKTVTKEKYVLRIDSASVFAMRSQRDTEYAARQKAETKLAETKDKLNWWKIACIITWALVIVRVALKIAFRKTG
jgi:hypothetical protein